MSAFSFLFEKTNKPALMICGTVHNDSDDYILLEPEQNDSKYSGLLALFTGAGIQKKAAVLYFLFCQFYFPASLAIR